MVEEEEEVVKEEGPEGVMEGPVGVDQIGQIMEVSGILTAPVFRALF